jgi:hypothetical protein
MSCPKIKKKQVETMLERYGVATACQNSELNEKKKQTNFKRYGTRAFNVEASKQTFVSHYGVDWNSKSKEFKEAYSQTSTQNWGVDHPFKSNEVRDKAKRTMKQRYGVENGAFLKKKGFYYAYDEQRFDSMWELAYYIYQKEHGVQIDRNSTKFFVLSNNKRFYPDFVINGAQYVEIKSNFWKLKQDWKRKSEVCKQESILVIDDALIQQYLSYVKETHGVNFLRLTRTKDQK